MPKRINRELLEPYRQQPRMRLHQGGRQEVAQLAKRDAPTHCARSLCSNRYYRSALLEIGATALVIPFCRRCAERLEWFRRLLWTGHHVAGWW